MERFSLSAYGACDSLRVMAGTKQRQNHAGKPKTGAKTEPKPNGRPSKLTKTVIEKICQLVRAGNRVETSAAAVDIHRDTLHDWQRGGFRASEKLKKGEKVTNQERMLARFSDSLHAALAAAEARSVVTIAEASKTDWKAAAWWLERRLPAEWRPRAQLEHSGPGGGPVEIRQTAAEAVREVFARATGQGLTLVEGGGHTVHSAAVGGEDDPSNY